MSTRTQKSGRRAEDAEALREQVKVGYTRVAEGTEDVGRANALARRVGYDEEQLAAVPEGANLGVGCGNPTAVAALEEGEVVLDLGSGGGLDTFLSARRVGSTGKVYGLDMTACRVILIGWVLTGASSIAGYNCNNSIKFFKWFFHTPEAAACKSSLCKACILLYHVFGLCQGKKNSKEAKKQCEKKCVFHSVTSWEDGTNRISRVTSPTSRYKVV